MPFLSETKIESFRGNVVALKLTSDGNISSESIKWSTDSDIVTIREFSKNARAKFSDGVLLTLVGIGSAKVCCEYLGEVYTAEITVREMRRASDGDEFNYYIGDMHDHTCPINDYESFIARTEKLPCEYIKQVKDEGLLDFTMISDHSEPLNEREFFDNFFVAKNASDALTVFPGCECDVTVMDEDRYGIPIKRSGEIVVFNCDGYAECTSWEQFYEAVLNKPFPVCTLAHPQIVGFSKKGIWDFALDKNNTPEMLRAVKLIETGDGSLRQSNLINEFVYSMALDNGFKVSTTCSSDSHGPVWGYHRFPGKTVIMAKERSHEAFLDAIQNNRVYGSESGNIKLQYSVNGITAPATLPKAASYTFKVKIDYFKEDSTSVPVICYVISDKGKIVKTVEGVDFSSFEFTVSSDSASYFFLRFVDGSHRRTWSPPVWTGRKPLGTLTPELSPIDKQGFTVTDVTCGDDASVLVNDDPTAHWTSRSNKATLVIDMHREEKVAGLGHYPRLIWRKLLADPYGGTPHVIAEFPLRFEISTSEDGVNYSSACDGMFRKFACEEIFDFSPRTARFVKLDILSNVGNFKGNEEFAESKIAIGELTVYKK